MPVRLRRDLVAAVLVGTVLLLAWRAAPASQDEPFFFIQMADPQFGMFSENTGFAEETALYERAIAIANRLHPAFVVVCGDLVNQPGNAAQEAELLRISSQLDETIPLHLVAGNHDVRNAPRPATLQHYRETIGDDRYVFRQGRTVGIVLDSSVISQPEFVPDEYADQLAWLKRQLAEARASNPAHILVFQHHSYFLERRDEPDQYFNIPAVRRLVFLDLLKAAGVEAVFAGHYHRNAYGRDEGLEMITNGPVGKPLGDDPSGLRIVKVYPDRIEHAYYGLGEAPASVTLAPDQRD